MLQAVKLPVVWNFEIATRIRLCKGHEVGPSPPPKKKKKKREREREKEINYLGVELALASVLLLSFSAVCCKVVHPRHVFSPTTRAQELPVFLFIRVT